VVRGRGWKPGDVVASRYGRVFYTEKGFVFTDGSGPSLSDEGVTHPLAVISPKDREQVERLLRDYLTRYDGIANVRPQAGEVDCMQAALREFANPKPVEPGKYGAVVAGDGREWIRYTTSERRGRDWCRPGTDGGTEYATWDDLDVIRVTNEGGPRCLTS
jgi:hypothetical protein